MNADVVIVGGGPAGLLLGHLLAQAGVHAVVVERQSAEYVLSRIRAGVLERTTTDLLARLGLSDRCRAEGLVHDGFAISDGERLIRIDLADLVGKHVTVYGQTEVTRDLMRAAPERGLDVRYECEVVRIENVEGDAPAVVYRDAGGEQRLEARFVCGCDGFHGPARRAIPEGVGRVFERAYPFGWLGILADVPPCHEELIYANHARGFALASMRSPTRSRYYVDVPMSERLEDWPDERIWDELAVRLGPEPAARMTRGASIEKSIAPLRSFVFEPMRSGSLFLAGDAAHIVPPTGAKGLNLAASDVTYLSDALIAWFKRGDASGVDGYSERALRRVWKSERFSWSLTKLLHRFPDDGEFEQRMRLAEMDYIAGSRAAQASIAENYVGLPV